MSKHGASHLLLIDESDVAESYDGKWTPAAVLINRHGRIASHNQYGDEAIRSLVASAAAVEVRPADGNGSAGNGRRLLILIGNSALKVGDLAPHFSVSDIQSASTSLVALARHPLLGSGLGTSPAQYGCAPFDSHCIPINIASTLGLPALIAFSFLIASL